MTRDEYLAVLAWSQGWSVRSWAALAHLASFVTKRPIDEEDLRAEAWRCGIYPKLRRP